MQEWLDKVFDISDLRGDENVFREALTKLAHQAGFCNYAYLHIRPGQAVASSNYPLEWRSMYFQQKFQTIDPIVKRAKTLKRAFTWSAEEEMRRASNGGRTFLNRAMDFGIRSGITIPVKAAYGSTSVFTLASDKATIEQGRDIDPIAAAAAVGQLHARMSLLPHTPDAQSQPWLDPREAAYINWISVGKTMGEAADLESVKYNSVKSKLEETRKRLNIHTMPHLVALAIRSGLI
ncbi:transcriptional regulator TraR [Agrobacterium sp. SORGH_AS 787]|uniref:autoinducer-binding transcriptional regulator TraR n=1 Tax=Agrobacterium sp. SORGH_AS 787 TaxID=3041775 RepID=UPI00277F23C3|nr:LuxR family transcriptional activator of conjugal transfer of Ti plasmids [Rhizobium sp. SORGH_AS_0787]